MNKRSIAKDVSGALSFHHQKFHPKYDSIHNYLGANLPALAQQMQDIGLIYGEDGGAKYRGSFAIMI
ncbi:MAG: hypothetical protein PVI55_16565 [Desulfobacterales bacterium]